MIKGIGVDLLDLSRIEDLYTRYQDRFVKHLLTTQEIDQFIKSDRKVHYLATRFSGKEAISKALGLGLRSPMTLHSTSIINDSIGKPELFFDSGLSKFLSESKVVRIHVTFSHESSNIISFAIAETQLS